MVIQKFIISVFTVCLFFSGSAFAKTDAEYFKENDGKPIFVILEVDESTPYIQSQVIVKVRLFRLSSSFDASMSVPHLSRLEMSQDAFLKELEGLSRRYRTEINENMYVVTERYYIVFPQQSGDMRLGPVRFKGYLVIGGTINFVEEDSNIVTLSVKPLPEAFRGEEWLPARSITYYQDFHPQTDKLELGQAISRIIYLTASGVTAGHLPVRIYKEIPGFKDYITESSREEIINEQAGLTAVINQEVALIAEKTGSLIIPDIVIPWWNTETDQLETLTIPGKKLESFSKAEKPGEPEGVAEKDVDNVPDDSLLSSVKYHQYLLLAVITSVVLAVVILPLLYRFKPSLRFFTFRKRKRQNRALKSAVRACYANDVKQAETALVEFCRTLASDQNWRSISACPITRDPVMADELDKLLACRYGGEHAPWNGGRLAERLPAWFADYLKSAAESADQTQLSEVYPLLRGQQ